MCVGLITLFTSMSQAFTSVIRVEDRWQCLVFIVFKMHNVWDHTSYKATGWPWWAPRVTPPTHPTPDSVQILLNRIKLATANKLRIRTREQTSKVVMVSRRSLMFYHWRRRSLNMLTNQSLRLNFKPVCLCRSLNEALLPLQTPCVCVCDSFSVQCAVKLKIIVNIWICICCMKPCQWASLLLCCESSWVELMGL